MRLSRWGKHFSLYFEKWEGIDFEDFEVTKEYFNSYKDLTSEYMKLITPEVLHYITLLTLNKDFAVFSQRSRSELKIPNKYCSMKGWLNVNQKQRDYWITKGNKLKIKYKFLHKFKVHNALRNQVYNMIFAHFVRLPLKEISIQPMSNVLRTPSPIIKINIYEMISENKFKEEVHKNWKLIESHLRMYTIKAEKTNYINPDGRDYQMYVDFEINGLSHQQLADKYNFNNQDSAKTPFSRLRKRVNALTKK